MSKKFDSRFYSLDLIRGLIVVMSVFLANIPEGGYEPVRHAQWYNVTILDFLFPGFVTIFGTSMAFAYKRGVHWGKLIKRTIRLILYGLIFNMIVMWQFNLELLRFTGVLQLYAVLGILTVLVTMFVKKERHLLLIAMLILLIHGSFLLFSSTGCQDGLPQMDCNPSGIVDKAIFGIHMYHQGINGFDPEGVFTMFAALSNVLMGYWAGTILLNKENKKRKAWLVLFLAGLFFILLSYVSSFMLPDNKKLWTPAFALMTAGSAITVLGLLHGVFDRGKPLPLLVKYFEAFGRNSFFIYFGKLILASLLANFTLNVGTETMSIFNFIYRWTEKISDYPQLMYALLNLLFWTAFTLILYKKKWYIKV